jgi:hypothetical protein
VNRTNFRGRFGVASVTREMLMRASIPVALLFVCACGEQHAASTPAPAPSAASSPPTATLAAAANFPAVLQPPAGQVVLLTAAARGVQIYQCTSANDAAFEWSLKGPDAELFDDRGAKIGKHYAGPTWEAADGSKVVGKKKAQSDAPTADAVPWLLLEAKSTEGTGTMTPVKSIQRIATKGGKAPATGCDTSHASAEVRVPYEATYVFLGNR